MNTKRRGEEVDFERVQAHDDVGDDFYALFLDPTMTYSCAKFDAPETTLEQAQLAKIDLSFGKCELSPGMTLLDIGCGWGATAVRPREKYGANVVGLTLSKRQHEHDARLAATRPGLSFRLEGWETFDGKVDRIVSIGAFEHFGRPKYPAFFRKCRSILPGGDVPPAELMMEQARKNGFEVVHVESLRPHYAHTLDCWAANLAAREDEATALAGSEQYDRYMKYLTGCANLFRGGETNLHQFKLRAN